MLLLNVFIGFCVKRDLMLQMFCYINVTSFESFCFITTFCEMEKYITVSENSIVVENIVFDDGRVPLWLF